MKEDARAWLAEKGYDVHFGARPLGRLIQVHIKDKLANEVLFGCLQKGGEAIIDINPDYEDAEDESASASSNTPPLLFTFNENYATADA